MEKVADEMQDFPPITGEFRFQNRREQCSYLPHQSSNIEYRLVTDLSEHQFAGLLCRGWRRMGSTLHRPKCSGCSACISVRVDVTRFQPSRSQRKNLRRNNDITLEIAQPDVTDSHIQLFNRYHSDMHQRRSWPADKITEGEYAASFLHGPVKFLREYRYWLAERLIGIGLVDQVGGSISSVYFFHDPEFRNRGLGTYSILREIDSAREHGLRFNYLGFWIADCISMSYKCRFRPQQRLQRFVGDEEAPQWLEHDPLKS